MYIIMHSFCVHSIMQCGVSFHYAIFNQLDILPSKNMKDKTSYYASKRTKFHH